MAKLCNGEAALAARFKTAKIAAGYSGDDSFMGSGPAGTPWYEFAQSTLGAFDYVNEIYGKPTLHSEALANIYSGGDDCTPTARAEAWIRETADPFLNRYAPVSGIGGSGPVGAAAATVETVARRQLGGLPVWAWALAALVVLYVWRRR